MRPTRLRSILQCAASRSRPNPVPVLRRLPLRPLSVLGVPISQKSRPGRCTPPNHRHAPFSTKPQPQTTSFPDPVRPDLFYYLVDPPTPLSRDQPAYALSFLPSPPPSPDSSTVIGWLPAAASEAQEAGLNDFVENPKFREILHQAIQDGLRDAVDEIQINGALQLQQGWMHIHDDRNIPPLGRIGDPDDILATVLVQDSQIIVETYQPMPAYRLCTSDGLTQLTPGLAQRLQTLLAERADSEKQ
ncbi:hypothetical protein Hypma_009472 [Hypsizygus marmoreus]|uniref:Uncharacterized protein n=1 Tax=Hypsizygus marmoreus TaxID=39966 RepID=A0A369JUK0_HYPMA|nr:hypothetical protein Hypma_009472 [Hypsizygus marmoreus]